MQKQLAWNTEPAIEITIRTAGNTAPVRPLANDRPPHANIRVALPVVPPRPSCLTRRALMAALREAELAEWMASGGDFLNSMHQRVG